MSLALLFPGQGAQFVGMGKDLADRFPIAAETFREADDLLGFRLSRLMWEGPEEELRQTQNAQVAILVHSVAAFRVGRDALTAPAYAAGHSLGEFSAHVAAETLTFADALRAVRRRGELMFEAGTQRSGTMAALLGMDDEAVERLCAEASRAPDSVVVPANLNAPGQIVISGDVDAVQRAMDAAPALGAKKVVPLNVSGAFHSPLMEPARTGLQEFLRAVPFQNPRFPVLSNVTARPVTEAAAALDRLVEQLTAPVRWSHSVATLVELGTTEFAEFGPGNVLSGLNKRNAKGIPSRSFGTVQELDGLKGPADPPTA
jgi:[acyl-carrier-protein] S-malonyltransferase